MTTPSEQTHPQRVKATFASSPFFSDQSELMSDEREIRERERERERDFGFFFCTVCIFFYLIYISVDERER